MSQSWRCQVSRLTFRGVRSALVTKASNQTTAEASSAEGAGPATGSNVMLPGR
jgi:hypothetical protein